MAEVPITTIPNWSPEDERKIIAVFAKQFGRDAATLSLDTQIERDLGGIMPDHDDKELETDIGTKFFPAGAPGHLNGDALWAWKPETIRDFLIFVKLSQALQPDETAPARLVPRTHYTWTQVLDDVTVAVGMALGMTPKDATKKIAPHEPILNATPQKRSFPLDDLHDALEANFGVSDLDHFTASLTPYNLAAMMANHLGKQGRMISGR